MIDEILNRMTKNLKLYETIYDEPFRFVLNKEETNILLDYINNRQERIDKAIDYIDKQEDYFNEYPLINRQELLDILKGSDKE